MAHVKIGPSFFRKERNEYSNHIRAFVREAGQNGIDAKGSDELIFRVWTDSDLGTTIVRFSNNGTPMTREVLENKLLSIGESGKNFEDGAVGGMGKAKLLLYFMHAKYTIRTGNLLVEGCGGEYSIREVSDFMDGTSSEVYWNEDVTDRLAKACHWFAQYLQWHGTMYVNDQKVDTNLRKGSPRREFSWGKVYTNKSFSNTLLVRISGIPMFSRYISHKGMVVVELTGTSGDRLTSNRDGLRYEYSSELDELINQSPRRRATSWMCWLGRKASSPPSWSGSPPSCGPPRMSTDRDTAASPSGSPTGVSPGPLSARSFSSKTPRG
jgi:hypothetical protein